MMKSRIIVGILLFFCLILFMLSQFLSGTSKIIFGVIGIFGTIALLPLFFYLLIAKPKVVTKKEGGSTSELEIEKRIDELKHKKEELEVKVKERMHEHKEHKIQKEKEHLKKEEKKIAEEERALRREERKLKLEEQRRKREERLKEREEKRTLGKGKRQERLPPAREEKHGVPEAHRSSNSRTAKQSGTSRADKSASKNKFSEKRERPGKKDDKKGKPPEKPKDKPKSEAKSKLAQKGKKGMAMEECPRCQQMVLITETKRPCKTRCPGCNFLIVCKE